MQSTSGGGSGWVRSDIGAEHERDGILQDMMRRQD